MTVAAPSGPVAVPPRRAASGLRVSPLRGVYVTSLVTAVADTPEPVGLSELAEAALDLIRRSGRPVSVLELAARLNQLPVVTALSVAELVVVPAPDPRGRPGGTGGAPAPVRQVYAPSPAPATRWRAWTAPAGFPGPTLHHDVWLVVSADESARYSLGPLAPIGPMPLPATDTGGTLWYGAALDALAFTSMIAVCGLENESPHWEWLARMASGALVVTRGDRPQEVLPARHRVPTVVLVETDGEDPDTSARRVCHRLGLPDTTPVVYGSAIARSDIDEAVRRLEER
ncbi:hypothetical protein SAMN05421803_101697 [Nocardiopsis flavescens]|uniref:Uncharacterized protein n=1 Tax=Nocardiopsis flavescens TaxID=758803 RepID=A0A1M6CGS4_9ACTN|nr:hypothetical protein SAMN05421803_101697 [Nocardiopsis flavescens]